MIDESRDPSAPILHGDFTEQVSTTNNNDENHPAVVGAEEGDYGVEHVNETGKNPSSEKGGDESNEPKALEKQETEATPYEETDLGLPRTTEESPTINHPIEAALSREISSVSLRDEESDKLGKEIFFHRNGNPNYNGWDNLRWMSYSGARRIAFAGPVCRFVPGRRTLFWSGDQYLERVLAVYTEPHLILILRPPEDLNEVYQILDLPPGATVDDAEHILESYLVVENVIDPKTCKLRLSPLTTSTSVLVNVEKDDFRRRSCFELVNPTESVVLSAVRLRKGAERALTSFTDSGAYLETTSMEHILQKSICNAHRPTEQLGDGADQSWIHQIILGTLHSHVVLGNQSFLDMGILQAKASSKIEGSDDYLEPRIIDAADESGRTPLHYACSGRFSGAVLSLVRAGANVDTKVEPHNMTPCHLCALHLDNKSLQSILAVSRRPNVVDSWERTPMYLATTEGRSVGQSKNPDALERCLSVLEAHGGHMETPFGFRNPVSALSAAWSHGELEVALQHIHHRYPVVLSDAGDKNRIGMSVSAFFQYPVHSCLITLRKVISDICSRDGKLDSFPEKSMSL